jgi:hypothetical protein
LERFEEATPVLAQNDAEVEGSVVAPHHSDEKVIPPAQESVDDETESAVPVAVHAPITETAPLPRRAAQPVSPPVVATAAEVHPAERWDTGAHDGDATDDSLDALLDRALGGAPRAPVVTATESLPDTPTRQQVLTTLRALEGEIRECAEGANGVVQTRLVVNGSTGRVSDVSVGGVVAGTPAARCATDILESARFPRFARERFEISFPYSV